MRRWLSVASRFSKCHWLKTGSRRVIGSFRRQPPWTHVWQWKRRCQRGSHLCFPLRAGRCRHRLRRRHVPPCWQRSSAPPSRRRSGSDRRFRCPGSRARCLRCPTAVAATSRRRRRTSVAPAVDVRRSATGVSAGMKQYRGPPRFVRRLVQRLPRLLAVALQL